MLLSQLALHGLERIVDRVMLLGQRLTLRLRLLKLAAESFIVAH